MKYNRNKEVKLQSKQNGLGISNRPKKKKKRKYNSKKKQVNKHTNKRW